MPSRRGGIFRPEHTATATRNREGGRVAAAAAAEAAAAAAAAAQELGYNFDREILSFTTTYEHREGALVERRSKHNAVKMAQQK